MRFFSLSLTALVVIIALTGCEKIENNKSYLLTRPPVSNPIGPRCDSAENCLAIHYVTYTDASGAAIVSPDAAIQNVANTNQIYASCGVQFQIDNYDAVNPAEAGFAFNTNDFSQLDQIRYQYGQNTTLLVVTTGDWTGSLHAKGANAWTQPPVANMFGVVMEARVSTYSNILAHEIGHYLNLYHVEDAHNVLNPVVYPYSSQLGADQCATVRDAIDKYWPEFRR